MKIHSKKIRIIALLLILTLLSCSCWDRRELNEILLVMGVGLDKSDEPDKIDLTIQLGQASSVSSGGQSKSGASGGGGGGGDDEEKASITIKRSGKTIDLILNEFTHYLSRQIFFSHDQVIIIGQDLAMDGVKPYLDFFFRDQETRPDIKVVVAKGTAYEILKIKSLLEMMPSMNVSKLADIQKVNSQSMDVVLYEFMSKMQSKTGAPVVPIVEVVKDEVKDRLKVGGLAVFKKDKMVGILDENEARGLSWVVNEMDRSTIELLGDEGKTDIEITKSKASVNVYKNDSGNLTANIKVQVNGSIGQITGYEGIPKDQKASYLEAQTSQFIENEIGNAIEKSMQLDADCFGFGTTFQRKHPREWKNIEPQWDALYPQMEIVIDVQTTIRSNGKSIMGQQEE